MKLNSQSLTQDRARKGTVLVVVATSMVVILSCVALSLDGGMLMDNRRQVQSVADSAALAASSELYANWFTNGVAYQGLDPTGTATSAALATAADNGYANGINGCTVTVNIPPARGLFANMPGHVEVIINATQSQAFSQIFGTSTVSYGARTVARGKRNEINNAIIVLDPVGKGALSTGGTGTNTTVGSPIQVNSSSSQAMIANGGGLMIANKFLVNGIPGWASPGGGMFVGPIICNSPPVPDPLANLPYPDPTALPVQSTKKTSFSGNQTTTLLPGVYYGGIAVMGGTVILSPGIYYMQGGGFSIGGQANISGSGVMIFNNPLSNSDTISLAGGGSCDLSPAMTGPYQGILIFQNRSSTTPVSVSGANGASVSISGTFYAAGAVLNVTGNGSQQTIGSQYISYDLALGGNGTFFCSWSAAQTPGVRDIRLIE